MSQQYWKKQETRKKNLDQGKNNPSKKYVTVFPSEVASSVGGKNFPKVINKKHTFKQAKYTNYQIWV